MAASKSKSRTTSSGGNPAGKISRAIRDPFEQYFSIGEAIATLFHPHVEVVLHDLRSERIVRMWNRSTDRQEGDLSKLNRAQDQFSPDQPVLGPYEKALPSQGRTKSITAGLRDSEGELIGFLCINLDVTLIDKATAMLTSFASSEMKRPEPIYRNDLQQHVSYLVRDYSLKVNKPIQHLSKQERIALVAIVDAAGLFQARNSIKLVAEAMHVSRASVYNLLADANKQSKSKKTTNPSSKTPKHNGARAASAGIA
jgi:D-arginine utilization repressor